jgi:multimeric flavodoxin WrbA
MFQEAMMNNIAIVYYSYIGHTKKVLEQLSKKLINDGNKTVSLPLETLSRLDFSATKVPIKDIPDVYRYDLVILGSPVHGGRISAPTMTFLQESEDLPGKTIILFLTHFFRRG